MKVEIFITSQNFWSYLLPFAVITNGLHLCQILLKWEGINKLVLPYSTTARGGREGKPDTWRKNINFLLSCQTYDCQLIFSGLEVLWLSEALVLICKTLHSDIFTLKMKRLKLSVYTSQIVKNKLVNIIQMFCMF